VCVGEGVCALKREAEGERGRGREIEKHRDGERERWEAGGRGGCRK